MEPLPLPPPPGAPITRPRAFARAGQLTPAWRSVFVIGWAGVILGFGSVVKTSRTMGLATWWLGPSANPRNIVIMALPFLVALVVIVLAFRNVRHLPFIGLAGAAAEIAIASGDIGRFHALAIVEMVAAGVGLLISIAAFAGRLRPARALPDDDAAIAAGVAAHPAGDPSQPAGAAVQHID